VKGNDEEETSEEGDEAERTAACQFFTFINFLSLRFLLFEVGLAEGACFAR
jgi:hypothetical protein